MNTKVFSVRFNLEKHKHRRAWEILQKLREDEGWSYPESIAEALIAFMENHRKEEDEAISIKYAERIADTTEKILASTIPAFLSGIAVRGGSVMLAQVTTAENEAESPSQNAGTDTIPDDEIPWDYLGE